jgi:hypothetical protein
MEVLRKRTKGADVHVDNGPFSFDVTFGEDLYSFDDLKCFDAIQMLRILLELLRKRDSWEDAFYSTWYYFENDGVRDDIHEYHRFFLCHQDEIIDSQVTISDAPPFSFPETLLQKDNDMFYRHSGEYRAALTRVCYDKWQADTLPGRIDAAKIRIMQNSEMELSIKPRWMADLWSSWLIPLVLVGIFVPERYSILFFLGVIWLALYDMRHYLRTQNYLQAREADAVERITRR